MDANGLHASFCSLSGCRTTCNLALVSTSVTVFHFRRELPIPERISPRLSHLVKPNPFGSATTLAGESGAASFTLHRFHTSPRRSQAPNVLLEI